MLKVLAAVIAIIVIALAVVLILASTKPDTFRVERVGRHQGVAGEYLPADCRLPSVGTVVRLMRPAIPR
jgi:hypothetical protein